MPIFQRTSSPNCSLYSRFIQLGEEECVLWIVQKGESAGDFLFGLEPKRCIVASLYAALLGSDFWSVFWSLWRELRSC
jgi:hypothetical protein